ncbi:MAG TPA: UbiA prenyltransferase family protein [Candidatus Woesebacteria bacterium]|nr:UbiA prenyltransferase family protein [Candidatus Woesebacteria bacterium]
MKIRSLIESLRPTQWIKNLSIFAASILNGQFLNPFIFTKSLLGFIAFCLLSSSSYLINDLVDIEKDKLHPFKKERPIARGDVTPGEALTVSLLFLIGGLLIARGVNQAFFIVCFLFIILQYSYSFFLKKKAIIDIVGIALFFIIRTYAGEVASGYHLPVWIMLTVIFLALFIAAGKRYSEICGSGSKTRWSLEGYGKNLLDFYITMFGVCTLICYALFTFFAEPISFNGTLHFYLQNHFPQLIDRKWYMVTLLPVIFGLMRYGQIIFEMQEGERPERVVATDIPLLLAIIVWGLMMITIVYVF